MTQFSAHRNIMIFFFFTCSGIGKELITRGDEYITARGRNPLTTRIIFLLFYNINFCCFFLYFLKTTLKGGGKGKWFATTTTTFLPPNFLTGSHTNAVCCILSRQPSFKHITKSFMSEHSASNTTSPSLNSTLHQLHLILLKW